MAAAQVPVSSSVLEEVREVLQALKEEEAKVEAAVKHAAEAVLAKQVEVVSGSVESSSQKSCHVEVTLAQLLPGVVHEFNRNACGAFTCGEAAFECATLAHGDATDIVKHTSSFYISIRDDHRVTVMFCDEAHFLPRVLGVLQARLPQGTKPMRGLGNGHGKWCF